MKSKRSKILLSIIFIVAFVTISYYAIKGNYKPGAGDYATLAAQKAQTMPYKALKDTASLHVPQK